MQSEYQDANCTMLKVHLISCHLVHGITRTHFTAVWKEESYWSCLAIDVFQHNKMQMFVSLNNLVWICTACYIIVTAVFQPVSSEFWVRSTATVQQLQLQVDGTADWMSDKDAESWFTAAVLWFAEVKSRLDSCPRGCKDVTYWMLPEWICGHVGVSFVVT